MRNLIPNYVGMPEEGENSMGQRKIHERQGKEVTCSGQKSRACWPGFSRILALCMVMLSFAFAPLSGMAADALRSDAPQSTEQAPLKIAVYGHYAPFTVVGPDGKPAGLLIDMWNAWSEATGRSVEFVVSDWSNTLDNIRGGDVDIHSGLFENAQRAEWMAFSEPIHKIKTGVFFRATDPNGVRSLSDMAGQRIGGMRGTHQHRFLEQNYPQVVLVSYEHGDDLVKGLLSGRLDAIVNEVPYTYATLSAMGMRGGVVRSPEDLLTNTVHAGVAKDRTELVQAINDGFAAIPISTLIAIDERWLTDPVDRYYRPAGTKVTLSNGEEQWLRDNPVIRLAVTTFINPVDIIDDKGNYSGLNADLIGLLNKKLGTNITPEFYPNWSGVVDNTLSGVVHGALSFSRTPERERHVQYTAPYAYDPVIVLTEKSTQDIRAFADLKGRTVSMLKGIALKDELIAAIGPQGTLIEVENDTEALREVARKRVDAHVSHMIFYGNAQRQTFVPNIKVAASKNLESGALRIGIHKSNPVLFSILNKGLGAIARDELAALRSKWLLYTPAGKRLETLTNDEELWIAEHPGVKVGIMADWPPFNKVDANGDSEGISVEIIAAIAEQTGLDIKLVPGQWKDIYPRLVDKDIDALMDVTPNEDRQPLMNFTSQYLAIPHSIIALKDARHLNSENDLLDKTIALEKGFGNVKWFRENHPRVGIREYPTTRDALDAVARGEAEAYVGNRAVATFIMQREVMHNLAVHGRLTRPPTILAVGARKDWPLLQSILQKGLDAVPLADMQAILTRWTGSGELAISRTDSLSAEEKLWVQSHTVRVGIEEWAPLVFFNDQGKAGGLAGDYLDIIAQRTGLQFEFVSDKWDPLLQGLKNRTIDVLPATYYTEERATYGLYSKPYFKMREFIYVRDGNTEVRAMEDLSEGRIAVVKGYGTIPKLKALLPNAEIVETKDLIASINTVLNGDVDALIEAQIAVEETIRDNAIVGLKGVTQSAFEASPIHLFSRSDHPILQSILQKGLDSITEEETRLIRNTWISSASMPSDAAQSDIVKPQASAGLWIIILVAVLIFAALAVFVRVLLRSSKGDTVALQMGSKRFRFMIIGTLLLLALLVSVVSWLAYGHNKNRILDVTGINLQTVLSGTVERLKIWAEDEKHKVAKTGRDPQLVQLTKVLLTIPRDKQPLQFSQALSDIRKFFKGKGEARGSQGFFIIAPDGISVGSMRNENLASKNLIAEQQPELFGRVLGGEAVFVPPIRSDVQLDPSASNKALPPTMFFAAPIIDENGTVLAVLTNRIDPAGDFTRITQTGNMGNSGESYAFDDTGLMMSSSRFEDDLIERGLLEEGQPSILNIVIKPPQKSVNARNGTKAKLTAMAESAIAGHAGINLSGYDDYRGTKVIGAWVWIDELGLGLTTEMDADEALSTVDTLRLTILTILGLTLTLSAGATLFTLALGERTSAALIRAKDELEGRVIERTAEVQRQRDLIKAVMDSMTVGVAAFDKDLKLIAWNQQFIDIRGYPEDMVHERSSFEDLTRYDVDHHEFGPGDPDALFAEKIEMARGFKPHAFERQRPNGTYIEVMGGPISGGGFVSTYADITVRKNTERALNMALEENKRQTERFRNLTNNLPAMVFQFMALGPEQIHITYASPFMNETFEFGDADENEITELFYERLHPDDDEGVRAAFAEVIANQGFLNETFRIQKTNGEVRWLEAAARCYEVTDGFMQWDGLVLDITERKAAEEELQAAEEHTRLILESAGEGVFGLDNEGTTTFVNPAACRILGFSPEDLIGQPMHALIHHSYGDGTPYPKEKCHMRAAFMEGAVHRVTDEVLWRQDGTSLPVEYTSTPIQKDGELLGAVVTFSDVTERKRVEAEIVDARDKAEAATKSKAAFLAAMSHEIRTPMNGVVGMISLLQETQLESDQRTMMNTVQDSAFSLLQIINDILDFSKIEAGKLTLESIPVNIDTVLEGVTETLLPNVAKKNLRMSLFIDPDIPEHVLTDQVRLRQILFNLAGNATKFTENSAERQGVVTLRAELAEPIKNGDVRIRLSIMDNGIGMKPEAVDKLFTPFTQADQSTTRKFGGTGLGLSICKTLADLMGGVIDVESTEGKGSAFHVTLPFKVAEQSDDHIRAFDVSGLNIAYAVKYDDTAEAVERYATAGGAIVTRLPTADVAANIKALAKSDPLDIIVLGTLDEGQEREAVIEALRADKDIQGPRFVLLSDDRSEGRGMVLPDMVVVACAPVRKSGFMHGVAMAAGRASPEIENTAPKLGADARKAPTVDEARATGELILVAEDNLTNQDVIRRQLNVLGYACEVADDGMIALQMIKDGRYGMLLTDCHMPNMDGYELTGAVRNLELDLAKRLPVVAITANALQGEADRCLASGMDDYMAKPLEMSKLKAMLAKWLPVKHGTTADTPEPEAAPAAEPAATDAVVNIKALTDMFGEDMDTVKEILGEYVQPSSDIIGEIDAGYEAHDADAVGKAGHKLKSSSRAIGADALADLCFALETAGKGGNWDEIEKLHPDLHPTFEAVVAFIEKL